MEELHGLRIHISGIVQGVGFRPFVYGVATRINLVGWVRNTSAGVDIEVDGTKNQLVDFVKILQDKHPPLARLDSVEVYDCQPGGFSTFEIVHSEPIPGAFIPISPDVSICDDCLREMLDPTDRRYVYPFINCTNCGPRFTIIEDIPYDRPKTTMAPFEMCPACHSEYQDPLNRRFHAQPVACPDCGPHVWLEFCKHHVVSNEQNDALAQTRHLLTEGNILAIKGLGGFHLACDATNPEAVAELRRRKLRVDKPFALMMPNLETVTRFCEVNDAESQLLLSRARPIVLLDRKPRTQISPAVAPNQKTLGVMLPYTPLHYLLFTNYASKSIDPSPTTMTERSILTALVMTSGNLAEEPIAYTNEQARQQLSLLADAFLMHNRDIGMRCDDSVYRIVSCESENSKTKHTPFTTIIYPLRRSRGYAPNPLQLPWDNAPQILATGPELKNTFCLTKDKYAFLSHHIGDMENYETLMSFENGIEHFERIFRIVPEAIACDLHPNYLASRYAQNRIQSAIPSNHIKQNLPLYHIQHHHAHIASCMADNGLDGNSPVIGISFDGTGYGDDGAIWGGEFLLADYSGYERFAHLIYTPLPGGDASTRKPARIALAHLWQAGIHWDEDLPPVQFSCGDDLTLLRSMLENDINCPKTSSIGRLFDSIAALVGVRGEINYEGQAAIEFEALVDPNEQGIYPFEFKRNLLQVDSVYQSVITDLRKGVPLSVISARFHNGLADIIAKICQVMRHEFNIDKVALSGGVWQNITLLRKTIIKLEELDFKVFTHRQVPANDGGLALGQAVIAIKTFQA